MGIRLMKNFNHPYFAKSISEFWRRWHVSLSTWFRDYVYIPLGGNRAGTRRMAVNLLITFLISGLWHGANWTFVIWGGLHGIYVVLNGFTEPVWTRLKSGGLGSRFPSLLNGLSLLATFGLVSFAWIFFRASGVTDAFYITTHLFEGWDVFINQSAILLQEGLRAGVGEFTNGLFISLGNLSTLTRSEIALSGAALLILCYVEINQYRGDFLGLFNHQRPSVRYLCYSLLVIAILALGTSYTGVQQAFIYFQF
jgi:hypothetical protein